VPEAVNSEQRNTDGGCGTDRRSGRGPIITEVAFVVGGVGHHDLQICHIDYRAATKLNSDSAAVLDNDGDSRHHRQFVWPKDHHCADVAGAVLYEKRRALSQ
jgi:hypothetical protein